MGRGSLVEGIYRASWLPMPEMGEFIGVLLQIGVNEADVLGRVMAVHVSIRRFDVALLNVNNDQLEYLFRNMSVPVGVCE
jgi:hypothetical protein